MRDKELLKLKREAREAELQLIEREEPGGLHVIVVGDYVVHWWPTSRKRTVYVEGSAKGRSYGDARTVIRLATGSTT